LVEPWPAIAHTDDCGSQKSASLPLDGKARARLMRRIADLELTRHRININSARNWSGAAEEKVRWIGVSARG
jgi:hypothetical protein